MKAAIYARFSSDKQTDKSIDDQVALCRAICEHEGLTVVGVYDDRAISGASTLNRLGWQRLMRDARAGKFCSRRRRGIGSHFARSGRFGRHP